MSRSGRMIVCDGNNGGGKSSAIRDMAKHLQSKGYEVVTTFEPGGTAIGTKIRTLVRSAENDEMSDLTGMMLFAAARAQNVHEVIIPALSRGLVILCDRFTSSSIAFQCAGQGMPIHTVSQLNEIATQGVIPDYTLVFDLDPRIGLQRTGGREPSADNDDKFELTGFEFLDRVRADYLRQAEADQERFEVIDASKTYPEVLSSAIAAVEGYLHRSGYKSR